MRPAGKYEKNYLDSLEKGSRKEIQKNIEKLVELTDSQDPRCHSCEYAILKKRIRTVRFVNKSSEL